MKKQERAKVIADMIADPEKFKRETKAQALKDNPKLTDEQLEASWRQVAHQFGL